MSLANYLTLIRLFISPIFLFFYLEYDALNIPFVALPYILLFLLGISELSDICDGFIARKYDEVTDLGKILDPMADSIYRISIFLTFTLPPINIPMILVFILLYRDFIVSTLRTICALKGFTLAARPSGKLKAIVQAIGALLIISLLIPYSLGHLPEKTLQSTSLFIAAIASVYTFFSGIDYIYANRHYVSKMMERISAR